MTTALALPQRFALRNPLFAGLLACLLLAACGGKKTKQVKLPPPINPKIGWTQTGVASWYGVPYHGRRAANGEIYDMNKLTAAHKRLPFETWLRVKNLSNGKTTEVRITDRGPFVGNRIIDLSKAAAQEIDMIRAGISKVKITMIRPPRGKSRKQASSSSRPASQNQAGKFDVQIGFFSNRSNAETLASKARKRGHDVRVLASGSGESTRYRVIVSGGSSRQANSRLQTLKSQGFEGFVLARRG